MSTKRLCAAGALVAGVLGFVTPSLGGVPLAPLAVVALAVSMLL